VITFVTTRHPTVAGRLDLRRVNEPIGNDRLVTTSVGLANATASMPMGLAWWLASGTPPEGWSESARLRQNPRVITTFPVVVQGKGPVPCDRLIVGEAPGRDEIRRGEPFVGRAGQTLDEWLASYATTRESLYITNAFKGDVGPGNPDPSQEQLQDHFWLLACEIAWLHPRRILSLGKVATRVLLPNRMPSASSRLADVVHRSHVCPFAPSVRVYPCYHPADRLTPEKRSAVDWGLRRFLAG
jgi:uracil-DNA glycosylase family 4